MRAKLQELADKFLELHQQKTEGKIGFDDFHRLVNSLSVEDENHPGCWWNIHPDTNGWVFYDGHQWREQAPEGFEPTVSPPEPQAPPAPPPLGPVVKTAPPPLVPQVEFDDVPAYEATTRRPPARPVRSGRIRAWLLGFILVILFGGGSGAAIWLAFQQLTSPPTSVGESNAEAEIEEILEDFFQAVAERDNRKLSEVVSGRLADSLGMEEPLAVSPEQYTTIANIETIARCLQEYRIDTGTIPYCNNILELQQILIDMEYTTDEKIFRDGWGNRLVYTRQEGQDFTLTSLGADNAKGPDPKFQGVVTKSEEDIIYRSGGWLQRPTEGPIVASDSESDIQRRRVLENIMPQGFRGQPEIEDIDIDAGAATASLNYEINNREFRQQIKLSEAHGDWKVVEVGRYREASELPAPVRETPVQAAPEAPEKPSPRMVAERFFSAYQELNTPKLRKIITGDLKAGFSRYLDRLDSEPEFRKSEEAKWNGLTWSITEVTLNSSQTQAKAYFSYFLAGKERRMVMNMLCIEGEWLISSITNADYEEEKPGGNPGSQVSVRRGTADQ